MAPRKQSLGPGVEPPQPTASQSINGSDKDALERFKIREICEGFPCHRDACEWTKMRDLFAKEGAFVFTTWSGGVPVDKFLQLSQAGYKAGVRIMHRAVGCTVDLPTSGPAVGKRGLGKLKAVITQRYTLPCEQGGTCEVDIECQCRLCFFVQREDHSGEWKAKYFKGIYEKDIAVPVDPRRIPSFDDAQLAKMPEGYRFLAYIQVLDRKDVLLDLPGLRGVAHDEIYEAFRDWLDGKDIAQQLGVPGA